MENDELLHKWVNGELSDKELEDFKQRPEYASLKILKDQTDRFAGPGFDEEGMLAQILAQDKQSSAQKGVGKNRFLRIWPAYAAAAAILLLIGFFFWPSPNMVQIQTAKGEQLEGSLPDGSTFVLNAESTLAYSADNWEVKRPLHLEGEAFFSVKEGETFLVKTPNGEVEVLGTEFNVWSRDQTLEVKCQSGKVAVSTREEPVKAELATNDAIRYTNGQFIEKWTVPVNTASSWREGISSFRKVPLAWVLEELARQFNLEIRAESVDTQQIVSCNFGHNDVNLALKTSLQPFAITYELRGSTVVLSAN